MKLQTITIYYLEMCDQRTLRPPQRPLIDGEIRQSVEPYPEFSRFLYTAVGGNWHWRDRLSWSHSRWQEYLSRPELETWVLYAAGTPAGYVELERQSRTELKTNTETNVEIVYFGLIPYFIGRGFGGHLLATGIQRGWEMGAERVWVHTCSLDHPHALANYQARGLQLYKQVDKQVNLPDKPLGPWRMPIQPIHRQAECRERLDISITTNNSILQSNQRRLESGTIKVSFHDRNPILHRTYTLMLWMSIFVLLLSACGRSRSDDAAPEADSDTVVSETPSTEGSATDATATDTPVPTQGPTSTPYMTPTPLNPETTIVADSGLQYTESVAGDGPLPEPGNVVLVHYTGTLEDGTVFDSSHNRDEPFRFTLGAGQVIPGWDEGIGMMNQGGQAVLVIPPDLGYGEQGYPGAIPPNAILIFDVELVEVLEGAPSQPTEVAEADYTITDSGVKYYDLVKGDGASPQPGQLVEVHYTGWLEDGGKFDSSLDGGDSFTFNVGMGQVIPGWDIGVATMNVGGKRQLVIPSEFAYGESGRGGVIPPNATLIFEVELLDVR